MHYLERWVGTALKELPRQDEALKTGSDDNNKQNGGEMEKKTSFKSQNWKIV
jgi:hypothetical protein